MRVHVRCLRLVLPQELFFWLVTVQLFVRINAADRVVLAVAASVFAVWVVAAAVVASVPEASLVMG
jgi:hypothetical protein